MAVILLRLGLALVLGMIVGVEREWRQKHAGLKTMALVALGAATFAMMSDTFGADNANPGMLAAAVVGGIGFIGAGVIMHHGATVQGVTTAATLWVDASVGVAVGLGQYWLAAILTATIIFLQFAGRFVEERIIDARRPSLKSRFGLRIDCNGESMHAVNETWKRFPDVTALHQSVERGAEHLTMHVTLRTEPSADVSALEEKLIALEGVRRVEVQHLGSEED